MGAVARLAEQRATVFNPLHPRDPGLAALFGTGARTAAGDEITPDSALTIDAFLSGVRYLAETVASIPLITYRNLESGGKERARELPLYERLHDQPNRYQTSFEWRDMLMHHLLLRGNFYAQIAPTEQMQPYELFPLHPDRVDPFWAPDGQVAYSYQAADGDRSVLLNKEILHIRFMPGNGLKGVSVIQHARDTLGLALAAERYAERVWVEDSTPSGTLNHPGLLSSEARRRLREEWEERHQGKRKIAVLMEGMKFEPISMTPEDAQALESRQLTVRQVARILRVQPHILMDLADATFSNVENQQLESVIYTLRPHFVRIEQSMRRDLLTKEQRQSLTVEFLLDGLLRGDSATRAQALAIQWQNGVLNGDEWRAIENRNPLPDGLGQKYYVPLNMIPANQVGEDAAPPASPSEDDEPPEDEPRAGRAVEQRAQRSDRALRRLRRAYQPAFEDAARRVLRRESNEVEKHFKNLAQNRSLADFEDWMRQFYDDHLGIVQRQLLPVVSTFGAAVAEMAASDIGSDAPDLEDFYGAYAQAYAVRHVSQSRARIDKVIKGDPDQMVVRMGSVLKAFTDDRPQVVAGAEVVQASSAVTRETWRQVGVTKLRWRTAGENCPLCESLDGEVVGIEQQFAYVGETIDGGNNRPLEVKRKTLHPPLHDGCDCTIEAA